MSSPPLSLRTPEAIRQQVERVVRERWVQPEPCGRKRGDAAGDEALARAVLDAMLIRPFRISKLPSDEEREELLAKVRHWVQRGKPIRIMLGYAPMKNLNTCRQSRADWAEFFALTHLCAWHNKVCSIYPPGLRIKIVFDDSTVARANRVDRRHMDNYIRSIGALVGALGYRSFIVGLMRQSSFTWLFHFGIYQWADWRVRRFERDPANQAVVEQMTQFARRNLLLPPGMSDEERERAYQAASHRYRVCWEALQISGLSKYGKSLIGMYLDGQQHHIRQQAALHLATLGKEQVTQPWQGEGGLRDNGQGKLVPLVLTAGRRAKMNLQTIEGLDLVRLPGFESIDVGYDEADASDRSSQPAEPVLRIEAST
jgi:hypothetical protein